MLSKRQSPVYPSSSFQTPTKSSNTHNPESNRSTESKNQKYDSSQTSQYNTLYEQISVSPFSLDIGYGPQLQKSKKQQVTDRFIPTRKDFSHEFLHHRNIQSIQKQNQQSNIDKNNLTVSDIYRKCFLTESNPSDNLTTFKNSNILKFHSKTSNNTQYRNPLQISDTIDQQIHKIRKINKIPYKVLDAPALQDDFYLNLLDWSVQNFLAVGLSNSVYLWNGSNSKVTKLCDMGVSDSITSLNWAKKGPTLAVGTNNGQIHLWDVCKFKKITTLNGHNDRVTCLTWSSNLLSSGSRDKSILHRDIRTRQSYIAKLLGHKQEVCGLKWSPDQQHLASGGNDNLLHIWGINSNQPIVKFKDHKAAVKALAWSPHQHGLLISGGGTADRTIKFRNILQGQTIKSVDTGSQVCNLTFSKMDNELVSTHGYSLNEVNVWKCPKMQKISTLLGHTMRVLYLASSPDGSTIVTGAGDETLRFWSIFPQNKNKQEQKCELQGMVNLR